MGTDLSKASVVIPNVFEYARKGMDPDYPDLLLARWRTKASGFADAALFWGGDRKLVISPRPVADQFVEYVVELLDYDSITVLVPRQGSMDLCSNARRDESVLSEIDDFVVRHSAVSLHFWGVTEQAYLLADEIERRSIDLLSRELPERNSYWSCQYIDSKVGFRELCTKIQRRNPIVQIPKNFICDSMSDALETLRWFHSRGVPCVLKASSAVGGFGNVLLDDSLLRQPFEKLVTYITETTRGLPYFKSGPVVVEELIGSSTVPGTPSAAGCASSLFMSGIILPDGALQIIGGGIDMRDDQCHYVGAEIGASTPLDHLGDRILPSMQQIAESIACYGYRGHWGVNFMVSQDGVPTAIELNARRCGESHAYALAERLYGEDWRMNCFAVTRFPYPIQFNPNASISCLVEAFEKTNSACRKRGVMAVPTQVSWLHHEADPGIGYVVIGTDKGLVKSAEQALHEQLAIVGIEHRTS